MADLEKIKKSLLEKTTSNGDSYALYEDPDFPANQTSVFYHQTPPFKFTWLRPKVKKTSVSISGKALFVPVSFLVGDNGHLQIFTTVATVYVSALRYHRPQGP